jgi:hypothetical protein
MPCAQKVDRHSVEAEQDAPMFFRPQELPLQTLSPKQFSLTVQALKQAESLQTYGLHGSASGATHWPVALQVEAGVKTAKAQVCGAQIVPILYFWQPPAPSHLPFVEQAAAVASLQTPRGSMLPAAVDVHLPGADASEQLRQEPVQSPSQHTPSTQ